MQAFKVCQLVELYQTLMENNMPAPLSMTCITRHIWNPSH